MFVLSAVSDIYINIQRVKCTYEYTVCTYVGTYVLTMST